MSPVRQGEPAPARGPWPFLPPANTPRPRRARHTSAMSASRSGATAPAAPRTGPT
ncbi:EF-hand domain-containing protein, partial [Xanthomonas perforans]